MPSWIVFGSILLAVTGMIGLWWREYHAHEWLSAGLVSVVLVGAGSNLFDRLWYGSVIDFIAIPWWSVFNLADIYIIAGVLALLYNMWHNESDGSTSSP
jgi:signal peptidase II